MSIDTSVTIVLIVCMVVLLGLAGLGITVLAQHFADDD